MAKKKTDHTTIRNGNLFCLHCGGMHPVQMPIAITMFNAMLKQFQKDHKNCQPLWKQPEADMTTSIIDRAVWWCANGEHGMSSKTIWNVMMEPTVIEFANYTNSGIKPQQISEVLLPEIAYRAPVDVGDFGRCYHLLKAIPEWKDDLVKMKLVSPVWSKLVDNWDILTQLFEEKKWKEMNLLMKNCGC